MTKPEGYNPPRIDHGERAAGFERLLSASSAIVQGLADGGELSGMSDDAPCSVPLAQVHELMKSIDEVYRPREREHVWYITQLIRECVDAFDKSNMQQGPPAYRRPTFSHDGTTISDPSLNITSEHRVDPFEEYGEDTVMAWLREAMDLVYVCFDLDVCRGGLGKVAVPLSWVCELFPRQPVSYSFAMSGGVSTQERYLRVARSAERLVHVDELLGRRDEKGAVIPGTHGLADPDHDATDSDWWIYSDCCVDLTSIESIHGYANDLYSLVDEGYITEEGAARAFGDAAVQTIETIQPNSEGESQ